MTHKKFRELLAKAIDIGMMAHIEVIGRSNYRNKRKFRIDLSHTKYSMLQVNPKPYFYAVRDTHYRRKYQVVINFNNVGKPYCRRISAKLLIIQQYQARLKELQNPKKSV